MVASPSPSAVRPLATEYGSDRESCFPRGDLLAVIEAATQHLNETALGMHGHARRRDGDDLAGTQSLNGAECSGDLLARIEYVEPPIADAGPRARCGIAAADQIVDGLDMRRPIDARLLLSHPAFVGGEAFGLRLLHGPAGGDEVGRLEQCRDAERKDLVEIDAPDRIVGQDLHLLLEDHRPFIEPIDRTEDRQSGPASAEDDRPVDRGWAAMPRQQRRMELDHSKPRKATEALRHELQDIGHHAEIDIEPPQGVERLRRAIMCRGNDRQSPFLGRRAQWVESRSLGLRGDENPRDRIAAGEEGVEHRLAECLLSDDRDPHYPSLAAMALPPWVADHPGLANPAGCGR